MKYIHILITGKTEDCSKVTALALVFDKCHELETASAIEYSVESSKEEIAAISYPDLENYSITFDWVGGRPNDRR